ncbi:8-amino-7-oxononanoate synthase [Conidiobolus coronatus NRRL 28638]|uniref:8-amino-7-oxononanoate synthase n=1 Tax=Conidiobolus coronatus (strain ATCC 28846 / CBS 209.66 / NRRL 28638) TaxID=796925 RepID=A0A137P9S2_CONC2|nr:8-amino-7-oxononanoate synthase [Conidiobolus coronatus NRRL 28638]|eukprot:KXN71756.1 8-amino-7-oxononanoate synthase [Conidiobolus coronatus NRRL 28638]
MDVTGTASGVDQVDFSSNDYLGLSAPNSPLQRLIKANHQSDSISSGSTGSRLLDGNHNFINSLESKISNFHKSKSGLIFNSGYDANLGIFGCLFQPRDIVIYDELIHASVHDGLKLSKCRNQFNFRHNDLGHLIEIVESIRLDNPNYLADDVQIFIAVEGIYSMEGDTPPLAEILDLCKLYNMHLIVDEAHSVGVCGPSGRGLCAELLGDRVEEVFLRLITFGKALANHGAIALTDATTREYLINYARPLIYSTCIPDAALSSISAVYDLLELNGDQYQLELNQRIDYFKNQVKLKLPKLSILESNSPVQGILVSSNEEANSLGNFLQSNGFMVRSIRFPTVPKGKERVRICIHRNNTFESIDSLLKAIENWSISKELGNGELIESMVMAKL